MTNITTIIDAGYDAFTNLYNVDFTLPTSVASDVENAIKSVRIADFTPPEGNATPYTVHYKLMEVERSSPIIELERKVTFTIRIDSEYKALKQLKSWKNIFFTGDGEGAWIPDMYNNVKGVAGVLDDKARYGSIKVTAVGSDTTIIKETWTYNGVVCSKIGTPTFTRENSDVVSVTAEFMFLTYTQENTGGS